MEIEPSLKYRQLKQQLIQRQLYGDATQLFEDSEFPAKGSSIGGKYARDRSIKWLRPHEIVDEPQLIIKGMTRDDIFQGLIRDCFLLAGAACIAVTNPNLLYRVVPPGQNFDMQYTGMFRFNFWRYDKWVEIIIDDKLPTIHKKLIMARNRNDGFKNEFWVSLMEKAYAKMNGSYINIDTGFINEAMVDLTGGISESVDVEEYKRKPDSLFDLMARTMNMSSFMGCAVNIEAQSLETSLENGLYSGHAYSVTKIGTITYKGEPLNLIRLRNPWGRKEWSGAWGDKSGRWKRVSEDVRRRLGFHEKEEGEFWMSFNDWMAEFKGLYFCHLTPDAFFGEIGRDMAHSCWDPQIFNGSWIPGKTAGGCGNHPNQELFWSNPQYMVSLLEESDGDKDGKISLIVQLSQKYRTDETNSYINFIMFKIKSWVNVQEDRRFQRSELTKIRRHKDFINVRDTSAHLRYRAGNYVIIPCTFEPNQPGEFCLRIFSENKKPPMQFKQYAS